VALQSAFWHVVSVLLSMVPVPTGAVGLLGLATVAVAGVLLLVLQSRGELADSVGSAIRVRAVALRERSRHSIPLRLRDPDAAGRPRPRAPGFASLAV
jgi:hypothetical protein